MNTEQWLVIDSETTGLKPEKDELLQLSIIDGDGNVLFNEYMKPLHRRTWKKAEEVNGISPAMVKDCKNPEDYEAEVLSILNDKKYTTLIGYNISFDAGFIEETFNVNLDRFTMVDVMELYAYEEGHWSERLEKYVPRKLVTCAKHYGYKWEEDAHNSLGDCKATLYCYKKMLAESQERARERELIKAKQEAEEKIARERQEAEKKKTIEIKKKTKPKTIIAIILIIIGAIWNLLFTGEDAFTIVFAFVVSLIVFIPAVILLLKVKKIKQSMQ